MNEPLTTSKPEVVFTGKSFNNHPHWSNQPLRLTEEQLNNPFLAFDDFFECYHLIETREILWQWLTAVLSSQGSISTDPLERSNHIYFYEKIEEIIEAAFISKTNQLTANHGASSKDDVSSYQTTKLETPRNADTILNKEKRLLEYANEDPLYVIKEVFNPKNEFTSDQLYAWLQIALTAESTAYEYSEDREQLKNFHNGLLSLTDALHVIYSRNVENIDSKDQHRCVYKVTVLSQAEIDNPEKIIDEFFKKYPTSYIDRELEDWLEAGVCHTGNWPDELYCRSQLMDTHRNVLCVIKVAKRLWAVDASK